MRAAFEHAVDVGSEGRGNGGVWKMFILFMKREFSEKGGGKVKEVWYRALRACPWVKELYIVGFEVLGNESKDKRQGVDGKELIGTWRVMGEKGLRVHVDLEEIFEQT